MSRRTWTLEAFRKHQAALRLADERFQLERDRRYTEGNQLRADALKILQTADETARVLARAGQDYKDEKANNLRSQIEGERGEYATKDGLANLADKFEAAIDRNTSWIAGQQGRGSGLSSAWVTVVAGVGCFAMVGSFLVAAIALTLVIYRSLHS